jgi:hypothetical protein
VQTVAHPPAEFVCDARADAAGAIVRPAGAMELEVAAAVQDSPEAGRRETVVDLRELTGTEALFGLVAEGDR